MIKNGGKMYMTDNFIASSLDETGGEKNEMNENSVDITIEIEERLFRDTQKWCTEHGITAEQLIIAFISFCVCPENYDALASEL